MRRALGWSLVLPVLATLRLISRKVFVRLRTLLRWHARQAILLRLLLKLSELNS